MSPQAFRETARARNSAFIKAMEDMKALQIEFNALGGAGFIPADGDPIWTNYDMTRAQFIAMLTGLGNMITVFEGGSIAANAARTGDLYRGKV